MRYGKTAIDKEDTAFALGQEAIIGLIALILGFSFAFAATRFEARRELVVNEAISIGNAYQRSDYLPAAPRATFRSLLVSYTKNRLEAYQSTDDATEARTVERGKTLGEQLWQISAGVVNGDQRNLAYIDLARAVDGMVGYGELQDAALDEHVPFAMIGLVVFCTIVGTAILGMTFGRVRTPHAALSVLSCILLVATVFTIIDLDTPKAGFIQLNLNPLRTTLAEVSAPR